MSRNQRFADGYVAFGVNYLGKISVDYSISSLPFRHLLKTPLSLLMLFSIGYLRKPQYVISPNI